VRSVRWPTSGHDQPRTGLSTARPDWQYLLSCAVLAHCSNVLCGFKSTRNMPSRSCGDRVGRTAVGLAGVGPAMLISASRVTRTRHRRRGGVMAISWGRP
jgi:hypothetical protein